MIEDPRSLLLNHRSLYSVLLIFDKHNSPSKSRIKTTSIRLFHSETPAKIFPQTKDLVKGSQNYIKETVYQRPLNSGGWNYRGEKRRESTFNLETKNIFGILQKDHKSFSNRLSNNAETPVLDQATYRKVLNVKNSAEQEQSYSTLHLKLDLFQLQLKKRRKKQQHDHSQTVLRETFWLRKAEEYKNRRCKMHQRHHLESWLQQVLISSNTAWKIK